MTPTEDGCVTYARLCTQMAVACEDVAARRLLLEMARDWMAVAMDEPGVLNTLTSREHLQEARTTASGR